MKVSVNKMACEAHGVCVRQCPEVFKLEEDILKILFDDIPEQFQKQAADAVNRCPRQALTRID